MRRIATNLSNGSCEEVDDPLMGHRHDALTVDLDDPVANTDSSSFCNAPSQQAAYLSKINMK